MVAAMYRTASLIPIISVFITLILWVNSIPVADSDLSSPVYIPSLHKLSEMDKNSFGFANIFKEYQKKNGWTEDKSTNFVVNDNELIRILKKFIESTETFQSVQDFCSNENEGSTETFLSTVFSTTLFKEMTGILATSTKTDEARLEQVLKSTWTSSKSVLRSHFCGRNAENWVSIFVNRKALPDYAEPITIEDQIIKSTAKNNARRLVPFGITPEFELTAASLCLISTPSNGQQFRPRIHKCELDLFPSTRSVVLNVLTDKDGDEISDIWYESSDSESPNATIEKERKKKRKPDEVLVLVITKMWDADEVDRLPESAVQFNFGKPVNKSRRGNDDEKQENLITSLDESIFSRPIYQALLKVYDAHVFHPPVCTEEDPFAGERLDIVQNFILTATNTTVFKLAYDFLVSRGQADENLEVFRKKLFDDWFGNYSRCGATKGSSGFEHVFCGEFRERIVDGHHSWVNYWLSQQRGNIDYYGYYTYRQKNIVTIRYRKEGYLKAMGGFLFRSSPAFDFSLFTVCYLTHRGNNACKFKIEGDDFWVTSFSQQCSTEGGNCIATTYPGTNLGPHASPDTGNSTTTVPSTVKPTTTTATTMPPVSTIAPLTTTNVPPTTTTNVQRTTTTTEPPAIPTTQSATTTTPSGVRSGCIVSGFVLLFSAFLRFTVSQIL